MSLHEKERNKKMPTPINKMCFASCIYNKQHVKAKQRCREGVMSDFVYWCRHLLVPFFFMK